jgi:hypothetical protein
MESMRFWRASERGISSGSCDPVMMMGFPKPLSMSESALAVYAMVSVPWITRKASYLLRLLCSILARIVHSLGPTKKLRIVILGFGTSWQRKAIEW